MDGMSSVLDIAQQKRNLRVPEPYLNGSVTRELTGWCVSGSDGVEKRESGGDRAITYTRGAVTLGESSWRPAAAEGG